MLFSRILFICVLCFAGCGDGAAGNENLSPCDLANAAMVTAAFEGTAAEGVPGSNQDCRFAITAGEVNFVRVFYFGNPSVWDEVRRGYEDNRGGTTDVAGLGEVAFYPNDAGPAELVVRTANFNFAVAAGETFTPQPASVLADARELAQMIASR